MPYKGFFYDIEEVRIIDNNVFGVNELLKKGWKIIQIKTEKILGYEFVRFNKGMERVQPTDVFVTRFVMVRNNEEKKEDNGEEEKEQSAEELVERELG